MGKIQSKSYRCRPFPINHRLRANTYWHEFTYVFEGEDGSANRTNSAFRWWLDKREACQGLLEVKDEEENTLKSHGCAAQENKCPLIHFQLKTVLLRLLIKTVLLCLTKMNILSFQSLVSHMSSFFFLFLFVSHQEQRNFGYKQQVLEIASWMLYFQAMTIRRG